MTNEARAEGACSLCLARRNKGYAQIIDIKVPTCWQQLSDKQLRFVFKLLNGNFSLPQVKTLCLLKFASSESKDKSSWLCRVASKFCGAKWAKMKILRREGSIFIIKYHKQRFPVSALQITEVTSAMEWLGDFLCQREQKNSFDLPSASGKLRSDFPAYPVRLARIGLHRPLPADFLGVPFGTFLALDNLYQGYLQTRKNDIAIKMARVMYKTIVLVNKTAEVNFIHNHTRSRITIKEIKKVLSQDFSVSYLPVGADVPDVGTFQPLPICT